MSFADVTARKTKIIIDFERFSWNVNTNKTVCQVVTVICKLWPCQRNVVLYGKLSAILILIFNYNLLADIPL